MFNQAIKQLVWLTGMMLLGFAVVSGSALACRSLHPEGSYTVRANDGVDLAYRIVGTGSQPVVLVHGWMVSGKIWDDLLPALDTSGLRLCIPDLRGTGNSDSPPGGYTLERYADDILTIAKSEHFCRFILVGHSMGGQIAQLVATKDPGRIKGLVLMASVPAAGMILPQEAVDLFRYSGGNYDMLSTILDLATIQLPPEAKARILDECHDHLVHLHTGELRRPGLLEALRTNFTELWHRHSSWVRTTRSCLRIFSEAPRWKPSGMHAWAICPA